MGTDHLDLDLGGTPVCVTCDDERGMELLRVAVGDHVSSEPAPAGFHIRRPTPEQRFQVVLDRSGFVLGRVRTIEHAVAIVLGHLSALLEPPADTVRFRMRSLLGPDDQATVALPPLLMLPPPVERRLQAIGYRIIDRLVLAIDPSGRMHLPRTLRAPLDSAPGHVSWRSEPGPVARLLVPGLGTSATTAEVVAAVAAAALPSQPRDQVLDVAGAISGSRIDQLDPSRPDDLYRLLPDDAG